MLELAKVTGALVKTTDTTWLNLSKEERRLIQAFRQMPVLEQRQVSRLIDQLVLHPDTP
jgi:hypothetical protein